MAEIPDVIQAKKIQLVDDSGNVMAELTPSPMGTPGFALRDREGNSRIAMALTESGQPIIQFIDQGRNIRLVMALNDTGEPALIMNNKSKEYRYLLTLDEKDLPYFLLTDGRMQTSVTADGSEKMPYRPPRPPEQQGSSRSWWRRFLSGEGC